MEPECFKVDVFYIHLDICTNEDSIGIGHIISKYISSASKFRNETSYTHCNGYEAAYITICWGYIEPVTEPECFKIDVFYIHLDICTNGR